MTDARASMLPVPGLNAPVTRADGAGSADGWRYTDALGTRIAELYADGQPGGLSGLHAAFPDLIPPARVVVAWRSQFPAFGLRMKDAERARAELLMEQTVVLADTDERDPRRVALSVATRQRMAARLDARWSDAGTDVEAERERERARMQADPQPVSPLDNATLERLAREGVTVGGGG